MTAPTSAVIRTGSVVHVKDVRASQRYGSEVRTTYREGSASYGTWGPDEIREVYRPSRRAARRIRRLKVVNAVRRTDHASERRIAGIVRMGEVD